MTNDLWRHISEIIQWLNGFVDWFDKKFHSKEMNEIEIDARFACVCVIRGYMEKHDLVSNGQNVYNLCNWSTTTKTTTTKRNDLYSQFSVLNEIRDSLNEKITKSINHV